MHIFNTDHLSQLFQSHWNEVWVNASRRHNWASLD